MKTKPRVVMFARNEDVLAAKWDKSFNEVSKKGISLIDTNDSGKFKEDHIILGGSLIHQDSIFIAHPYSPNTYVNVENDVSIIQREKLNRTAEIASALGAKGFNIKSIHEKIEEKDFKINSEGSFKLTEISSEVNNKSTNSTREYYSFIYDYNGCEPDYKKAKEMLSKYGLENDPEIRSMVEMRNPDQVNLLNRQRIKLKVSSELNETLDIAARLSAMGGVLSLSANYNKNVFKRSNIELIIDIKF